MTLNTTETGLPKKAKVLFPTPENIALVAAALTRGEVVGMPTETVYGLAGDVRSPLALTRIFTTKERPTFDPLIIHVGLLDRGLPQLARRELIDLDKMTSVMRQNAKQLIETFWPGPLTLVFPKHPSVDDLATSGLNSVALRMPRHPVALGLIAAAQTPLAAPSANRFGRISPTTPAAVVAELGDRIDWVLDGGPCEIGLESTILFFHESGEIILLRPGGTPRSAIEARLGVSLLAPSAGAPIAPGMLPSHYAPRTPLWLLPGMISQDVTGDSKSPPVEMTEGNWLPIQKFLSEKTSFGTPVGLMLQSGEPEPRAGNLAKLLGRSIIPHILSPSSDLAEMARNLFRTMRELDASSAELILVEPCPVDDGLGHAIADRLGRAKSHPT